MAQGQKIVKNVQHLCKGYPKLCLNADKFKSSLRFPFRVRETFLWTQQHAYSLIYDQ